MNTRLPFVIAACLVCVSAAEWVAAQQPTPVRTTAATTPPPVDDVVKAVRNDLQGSRAEVIAKNVALTSEQAARFWPMFEMYQQEQNVIMDEQLKGLQQYVDTYERLDDASALGLLNAHLERDTRMVTLRQRWLAEFQKVLPTRLAARVIQIDRRLSLVHQLQFSSVIPLVQ